MATDLGARGEFRWFERRKIPCERLHNATYIKTDYGATYLALQTVCSQSLRDKECLSLEGGYRIFAVIVTTSCPHSESVLPAEPATAHPPKTPIFLLHFVQLSGNISLLGAEQVTWRFAGPGINIVAGGNGSGKSLLCSAIQAAAFPAQSDRLREGLAAAGLLSVTIVGQLGAQRREWELDIRSGEVVQRPRPADEIAANVTPLAMVLATEGELPDNLPHVIANGHWMLPDRGRIAWAEAMVRLPLERELQSWQNRLDNLIRGSSGSATLESVTAALERQDTRIAEVRAFREEISAAHEEANALAMDLTEVELRLYMAGAEETELKNKIEIAERASRLESWATELKRAWKSVEGTREQFAKLQERLEIVQEPLRGLSDQAGELAREYLQLQTQEQALEQRLTEHLGTKQEFELKLRELEQQLSTDSSNSFLELEQRLVQKREAIGLAEHDLTELSRQRIDLLRQRDGFVRVRAERFRELSQLNSNEWRALEEYLAIGMTSTSVDEAAQAEAETELAALRARLERDFSGFDTLPDDTSQKIEKLFAARSLAATKESDLAHLRDELADEDRKKLRTGIQLGLTTAGVLGAGLPAGIFLGADIGFFGALLGGGAGFGVARLLLPSSKAEHDEHVRQIEMLQMDHASAVKMREILEREITPLDQLLSPEGAKYLWNEFLTLRNRERELCALLETHTPESMQQLPALLRKLETEDIQRKVTEFRELNGQLEQAEHALSAYDSENGPAEKAMQIEIILQRIREEAKEIEQQLAQSRQEQIIRQTQLDEERSRVKLQLQSIAETETDRRMLDEIKARVAELDSATSGHLGKFGAQAILDALNERESLLAAVKEAKSRLSLDHSPQELGARAELIEEELAQVTERLQEIDPLYGTLGTRQDGLDKYRAQLENVQKQIAEEKTRQAELNSVLAALKLGELEQRASHLPSEEHLLAERAVHQLKLEEIQRSVHAAQNMCDALRAELVEQREKSAGRVVGLLKKTVFDSIGERIASVELSGEEWIAVLEDGQRRPLSTLSRGIAELVTLCLNAGLLTASENAEVAPIIWDDVLSQLDDFHLSIARQIIEQLARKRQVVLLTRDSRMRSWGSAVEVFAGRHELSALLN